MRLPIAAASKSFGWVMRLGGPGIVLVALVDNSFIPIPGGVDIVTILLAAGNREWWWYYAAWATVGSVIGGYLTFRLGRKGGEEALEKKIPKSEAERVYRIFRRFGFWTVFVGALLPPPVPIVPFLLAPGILEYSRRRFLLALTLGRGIRYTIVAYLASRYGRGIISWIGHYYKPILISIISVGVVAGIVVIWYVKKRKRIRKQQGKSGKRRETKVA